MMNNTNSITSTQTNTDFIILSSCLTIIGSIVMIMNIMVFYAAVQISLFRKSAHYNLVLGLTFADCCGSLGLLLTGIRLASITVNKIIPLCIINIVLFEVGIITSFNQTFLICLNRYLVMTTKGGDFKIFQGKYTRYLVYASHWTEAVLIAASFFDKESVLQKSKNGCNLYVFYGDNFEYFRIVFCSTCMVKVSMTVVVYIRTLLAIRRALPSVHPQDLNKPTPTEPDLRTPSNEPQSSGGMTSHSRTNKTVLENHAVKVRKTTNIVGILLLSLLLFTGPMIIVNLVDRVSHTVMLVTVSLTTINSMINPIIYCAHLHILREKFKAMFCASVHREN